MLDHLRRNVVIIATHTHLFDEYVYNARARTARTRECRISETPRATRNVDGTPGETFPPASPVNCYNVI